MFPYFFKILVVKHCYTFNWSIMPVCRHQIVLCDPAGGSWSSACSPYSYINGTLKAFCGLVDPQNNVKWSVLDTSTCSSTVSVSYGNLVCTGTTIQLPGSD